MGDSADLTRKALMIAGTVGAGMIARKLARQPQQSDLRGQVVFITGGSRGLGLLMAREFAREGCRIAICARDVQELEGATRDIEQIVPSVLALPCDVADQSQVSLTLEKIIRHFGQIDVLVNNAGIFFTKPFTDYTADDMRSLVSTNIEGFVYISQLVIKQMLVQKSGGSIITMTYYGAEKVVPHYNVMGVAKAALECTVRYLANDLGPKKIRVNAISAGPIKTLAARGISGLGDMLKSHAERAPLKRNVDVNEVGATGVFLASDASSGITGEVIYVDCGYNVMGF